MAVIQGVVGVVHAKGRDQETAGGVVSTRMKMMRDNNFDMVGHLVEMSETSMSAVSCPQAAIMRLQWSNTIEGGAWWRELYDYAERGMVVIVKSRLAEAAECRKIDLLDPASK